MPVTRRDVVRIALAAPLGYLAMVAAQAATGVVVRAAPSLRPASAGTSAARCAACGAADHTMLDPRCPAAGKLLASGGLARRRSA